MSYNRRNTSRRSAIQVPPTRFPLGRVLVTIFLGALAIRWAPIIRHSRAVLAQEQTAVAVEAPVQISTVAELATATLEPPIHIAWLPATLDPYLGKLADACNKWKVDPRLCAIVTLVESGGNPYAVSESGAYGLMQIMPPTADLVSLSLGTPVNIYNIDSNVNAGAFLLGDELFYFGFLQSADPTWRRSVMRAAAAFNGSRKYADELIDYESLQVGGNCALYYPEVYDQQMHRYSCWVGGLWDDIDAVESDTLNYWLASGGQRLIDEAVATQQ